MAKCTVVVDKFVLILFAQLFCEHYWHIHYCANILNFDDKIRCLFLIWTLCIILNTK